MNRSFSLATLLLLVLIAAVGSTSLRAVVLRIWSGDSQQLVTPIVAGAGCGLLFGFGLALWERSGVGPFFGSLLGGLCLGGAAGAQMCMPVDWTIIFVSPLLAITVVGMIAAARRRQIDRKNQDSLG